LISADFNGKYFLWHVYILPFGVPEMSYNFTYTFPALKGIQAGREYYVAMCPLKLLPKLFLFDEPSLPPQLRAQRSLNTARIPEIARYVLDNQRDYAFSAITASVDGDLRFEPANVGDGTSDVGRLVVSMSARFLINDGQHRRAAIEAALEEQPDLGDETISVVFYSDAGLRRSQQLFADLNKHAVRPTKSIGLLYDLRDPLATLTRNLVEKVPYFKGLTDLEKTSISNRSIKLFTLSGIHTATCSLLGKHENESGSVNEQEEQLAARFWTTLGRQIPEWQLAVKHKVSSYELRKDYIHVHSVTLHALGIAGCALLKQHPKDWQTRLRRLSRVNWSRDNRNVWEGRAMVGGNMSKARQNVQLTASLLKKVLGLSLSPEEARLESRFQAGAKNTAQPSKKAKVSGKSGFPSRRAVAAN
jgi:DNA sulfur modification protein DndB